MGLIRVIMGGMRALPKGASHQLTARATHDPLLSPEGVPPDSADCRTLALGTPRLHPGPPSLLDQLPPGKWFPPTAQF